MPRNLTDNRPDDLLPDAADAFTVDGVINRSVGYLFDLTTGKLRAVTSADQAAGATQAGQGALLGQATAVIDATARQLTSPPAGAGYARLQFHGAGVYARYDGTAASGSAAEEQYAAGGTLEITSAADIAGFRYVTLSGTGSFSVLYRSY
ncbi:hypothetical protein Q0M94_28620 (plasmid) [Deinococcus radiomollis]|uniref:hypothetical protein n=1 Tax=Deinococcus radiomollis TaxID=468916 RepID=UPI00389267AD